MILTKTSFSEFPFKVEFSFKKRNWYLFPQGCGHKNSAFEKSYHETNHLGEDIYKVKSFWNINTYDIFWLCFHIKIRLNQSSDGLGSERLTIFKDHHEVSKTHISNFKKGSIIVRTERSKPSFKGGPTDGSWIGEPMYLWVLPIIIFILNSPTKIVCFTPTACIT